MDDLIPPSWRLLTKPVSFTHVPKFRTTHVYYVSERFLSTMRKQQAPVTLEVVQLQENCEKEIIGTAELHMKDAKLVKMRNERQKIAQIQQFVLDKGGWIPFGTIGHIKAGLFIVKMPHNSGHKEMGTPLQTPITTSNHHLHNGNHTSVDLGLEICSDMSDLFFNSENDLSEPEEDDYEEQQQDEEEDPRDEEEGYGDEEEEEEEDDRGQRIITIGEGEKQHSFLFRILEAKHISDIVANYSNIEHVFFRYQFAKEEFQCDAESHLDGWRSMVYHQNILIQGDLPDIKEWLASQSPLRVRLFIKQYEQEEELMIGFADIHLKDRELNVVQQSSIIYDYDKHWYINEEKEFAKLQLLIGILDTWDDHDFQ